MIITRADEDGKIIAFAEFRLVNERGADDEKGIYVWINEVWVHESYRSRDKFNSILKDFINSQAARFSWCEYIYWQRNKYDDKMSLYNRSKIMRRTIDGRKAETTRYASTFTYASATADPTAS